MNVQIDINGNSLDVRFAGELTIYNASDLRQRCMEVILHASSGMNARIDMSDVTEIDGAGIQLMVILKRELLSIGMFTKITSWSMAVSDSFNFVGFPEFLAEGTAWVE